MQKKLLSILLVLCMLLSMFPITLPVSAEETVETVATDATAIADAAALVELMNDSTKWAGDYVLTADIDLSLYNGELTQQPIGNTTTAFTGTFDGAGHTISGLNISGTAVGTGLFGVVSDDGDTTVITNFTIEGSVTSTARFTGGAIGIICGAAEVSKVTSNLTTFSGAGTGRLGGVIGGIVNNNALGDISSVENAAGGFTVTVSECVNNTDITTTGSQERVGGIVGTVSPAAAARTALTVVFENCVNNGDVSCASIEAGGLAGRIEGGGAANQVTVTGFKNYGAINATVNVGGTVGLIEGSVNTSGNVVITKCSNYAAVNGTLSTDVVKAGGIVGYSTIGGTSARGTITVSYCYNEGAIGAPNRASGNAQIGGIVGYTYLGYTGNKTTINNCWNKGTVTTQGNDAGGIVGIANTAEVYDCWNTGAVSSTAGGAVGGIVGRTNSTNTISRNYNAGTVTATGTHNQVVGKPSGTLTATANYYSAGNSSVETGDAKATYVADADVASAASFSGLNANSAWLFTDKGPELAYFHEHDLDAKYVVVDGGHATACYCNDTTTYGTTEDHAMEDGVCSVCGAADCAHENTTETVTLAATCLAVGYKNVVCSDCGTTTEVEIAIDEDNHVSDVVYVEYDDDNGCITYKNKCCDAVVYEDWTVGTDIYVSSTGITVDADTVIDSDIGLTAKTAFADFEFAMQYAAASVAANSKVTVHIVDKGEITTANYATPKYDGMITVTGGELWFMTGNRRWFANGDVTFENLTFKTNATNGVKIYAQNHKMVMGEGIVMGNEGTITTDAGYPDVNNVKMYLFGGFEDPTTNVTMDTDLTIRSGDYWAIFGWNNATFGKTATGEGKITYGKTDADDYLFTNYLIAYSTDQQFLGDASKVTVIIDGDADVRLFYYGTQNDLKVSSDSESANTTSDILYETDLVLKGNLNTVERKAPDTSVAMGAIEVMGTTTTKNTKLNIYVDERVSTAVADRYRFYGTDPDGAVSVDTTVENMQTVVTVDTYITYCNTYLTHTGMDDDICDECGYNANCAHDDFTVQVITPSTCSVAGVGNHVCTSCSDIVKENVALDLDASNHDMTGAQWEYDTEKATNVLKCPNCSTVIATAETPIVYVDANIAVNVGRGVDTQSGVDVENAVLTLEEAVTRLAKTGGTVVIADRYIISGDVTLPKYEKLITITSLLKADGALQTGFTITSHGAVINLGGPTKFEKIIFNGGASTKYSSDANSGYYRIPVICANWHDLEFGENISTYGAAYIVAGSSYDSNHPLPSATNDTAAKVKLVFNATSAKVISTDQPAVRFYENVYLGDRVRATGSSAITTYTVSNKTVTADFKNATVTNLYTATTSPATIDAQMTDYEVTVNAYGTAYIHYIKGGDGNTSTGTAYMDKLAVNFLENSCLGYNLDVYNVRDLDITISTEKDGRNTTINGEMAGRKGSGYTSIGTETADITYGSHAFKLETKEPYVNAMYAFTRNRINECDWDEGKITTEATPDADGVRTFTCSTCTRTYTESVKFECTEHVPVAKADGTYYCLACNEVIETVEGGVIIAAAPATVENGTVKVEVKITATTPFWGTEFAVDAPEGFTLTGVASELSELDLKSNSFAFVSFEDYTLPYGMSVVGQATDENSDFIDDTLDAVVVTLTFTVADTVEDGTYVIEITCEDTTNVAEEAIPTVAVSAEVTLATATHTHNFTNWTDNGNGTHTGTCECSETSTEEHGTLEQKAEAVAPGCETTGKTAVMGCTKCKYTEGGDEEASNGHDMKLTAEQVDATCTTPGTTAVYTCANDCGHTEG
ncbi:MAG: hypothetical protein IJ002_01520, partial [Clostridia bacterium]|nr:hypothetical protein [Clostridia bacterium]